MRMLLKVSIPVEAGMRGQNSTLGSTIQRILDELKPEAPTSAKITASAQVIFFDMKESSQLPASPNLVPGVQCKSDGAAGDEPAGPRDGRRQHRPRSRIRK